MVYTFFFSIFAHKRDFMSKDYYDKPENVLFYDPVVRFLAKLFGSKYFIKKCEVCNKIPTELYGKRCKKHINL